MTITIYCEGESDKPILNHILDSLLVRPRLVPTGGKRGAGEFIKVHHNLVAKTDFYLFFRDRDFDIPIEANTFLHTEDKKDTKKVVGKWCYSYRNTIENYLFNAVTFFTFLEKRNECEKYNLKSESEVKAFFDVTAKELTPYQSVRHALGKMRIRTDFGTKWTDKSGVLPKQLDLDFCKNSAWQLVSNQKIKIEGWTEAQLDTDINEFLSLFSTNDFYKNSDYLVYFQGKDFAKRISQKLQGFQIEKYYEFAAENFDYTQFPDLVELRDLITSLSK